MSGSGTGIVTPYPSHRGIDLNPATPDYYVRAADLVGTVDGRLGIFSGWLRKDTGDGANQRIFINQTASVFIAVTNFNRYWVRMQTVAPATILEFITDGATLLLAGTGWHHLAVAWSLRGVDPTADIYVDGVVPGLATNTVNAGIINYAGSTWWAIGANNVGVLPWQGAFSEIYFNPVETQDITVAANLANWRHPNGQPPSLLADGSGPTGTQPVGYWAEEAGVLVNRGSGGAFVAAGAPALSADSPKDRWVASLNYGRRRRSHFGG